jgi:hypothetical protein
MASPPHREFVLYARVVEGPNDCPLPSDLMRLVAAYTADLWDGLRAPGASWFCENCRKYSPRLSLTGMCRECDAFCCPLCATFAVNASGDKYHQGWGTCICFRCGARRFARMSVFFESRTYSVCMQQCEFQVCGEFVVRCPF